MASRLPIVVKKPGAKTYLELNLKKDGYCSGDCSNRADQKVKP